MKKDVIVIGGGAAGLMACGVLARRGRSVILLDKNKLLARKLRITGKGRCNITNNADISEIFENIPTNPKFLYSSIYSFTNEDVVSFFEDLGVRTKVERGGRVFPVSDSAKEVADALVGFARHSAVTIVTDTAVGIDVENGRVCGVKGKNASYEAESVIIATGGASYPKTGSDGSGFKLAEAVGHTIIEPKPSLIPIITEEKWVSELMGLSLKNVTLSVYDGKREIFSELGEMLFTHFGVSGPLVLSASAHMRKISQKPYSMMIDLKPGLDEDMLDKRILRDFSEFKTKHLINAMDKLLPKALIPVIIRLSGVSAHKDVAELSKEERRKLVTLIKHLPLKAVGFRPIDEAIITSGGVKVSEIEPSSMRSKIVDGLYFAGEVIDVDAYTGGFNLQIAFSTGHLAGENA